MSMLAVVCKRLKVSQAQLSRRSGLARQTVANAYHGRPGVSLDSWVAIAKALHVPLASVSPLAAAEFDGLVVHS